MTHNVFANNWEISTKAGTNKSISRFPDVCLSPPGPPAGPIPIPYPDTSFSTDLKEGTHTVEVGGQPVALAEQSYYLASVLGNEAATTSFGASVVTHKITGKTYFQAWSMDVKFEGKGVCRHNDITTSNHNSPPAATPPMPSVEMEAQAAIAAGKCPCCGQALHDWQKDDSGKPLKPISEQDYWEKRIQRKENELKAKLTKLPARALPATQAKLAALAVPRNQLAELQALKAASRQKVAAAKAAGKSPAEAAKAGCLNVNPNDGKGCGTYFDTVGVEYVTNPKRVGTYNKPLKTPSQLASYDFTNTSGVVGPTPKAKAILEWEAANPPHKVDATDHMDHKTPKQAGGCNSAYNTAPRSWYSNPSDQNDPCARVEYLQKAMEDFK